jgi:hypothetical protein
MPQLREEKEKRVDKPATFDMHGTMRCVYCALQGLQGQWDHF